LATELGHGPRKLGHGKKGATVAKKGATVAPPWPIGHGAAMEHFQSWMAICFTVSIIFDIIFDVGDFIFDVGDFKSSPI
jgi:hypothetical protein